MQITRRDYDRKRAHNYAGPRAELADPGAAWMHGHTHWMLHNDNGATTLTAVTIVDTDAYRHGYATGRAAADHRDPHTITAGAVSIPSRYTGQPADTADGYSRDANDYAHGYHDAILDARAQTSRDR